MSNTTTSEVELSTLDILLVKKVKNFPILYKKNREKYETSRVEFAWEIISHTIGLSVQECKNKWERLLKEYMQNKEKDGADESNPLHFLDSDKLDDWVNEVLFMRKDEEESINKETSKIFFSYKNEAHRIMLLDIEDTNNKSNATEKHEEITQIGIQNSSESGSSRKRMKISNDDCSAILLDNNARKESILNMNCEERDNDIFFENLATYVCNRFSLSKQEEIRSQIDAMLEKQEK